MRPWILCEYYANSRALQTVVGVDFERKIGMHGCGRRAWIDVVDWAGWSATDAERRSRHGAVCRRRRKRPRAVDSASADGVRRRLRPTISTDAPVRAIPVAHPRRTLHWRHTTAVADRKLIRREHRYGVRSCRVTFYTQHHKTNVRVFTNKYMKLGVLRERKPTPRLLHCRGETW